MRKRLTLRSVQSRGHSGFAKMMTIVALLLMAVTGAWAQSTPTEVSTFADLQTALSAGNDVKLTANIQFTSAIEISGSKKILIDGNGKTMSGPSTCAFIISSGNTLAIKNATIDNFDRSAGGGAIRNNGTLVLDGCTVSNNHTDGNGQGGGAIENQGTLYASNTTFSGNYSSEIGGAINNYGGKLYLSDCTFTNNYTTSSNANYGGAIGNNSSNTVVIVNCTFSGNKYGGSNGSASDLGVFRTPNDYTIAGCTGITIEGATLTTYQYGTATPDYSDLSNIKFDYQKSATPIAAPATYTVSLNDGTENPTTWTASTDGTNFGALPIGGLKGDGSETVTLKYNGRLKVKSVTATSDAAPAAPAGTNLSDLTADYEAQDGDILSGVLGGNYKITIADGATVTLAGVTINGVHNTSYTWAGLNCVGDATIILADGTDNTVKGFHQGRPGILVPSGKTLTIKGGTAGTGTLTASSNGQAAGIGGGSSAKCGNISIEGGFITATGGNGAAGIGGGGNKSCGNISITGGDITATGGYSAAGIGGGTTATCGTITIANTVTKVTATKGAIAPNSIGASQAGTCGTVTIGGTKYWENNAAVNGGDTYLATSPLEYQP